MISTGDASFVYKSVPMSPPWGTFLLSCTECNSQFDADTLRCTPAPVTFQGVCDELAAVDCGKTKEASPRVVDKGHSCRQKKRPLRWRQRDTPGNSLNFFEFLGIGVVKNFISRYNILWYEEK